MADSIKEYKCPNCGAPLAFDGSSQKLRCSSCDSSFDVDEYNEIAVTEGADNSEETNWNQDEQREDLGSYKTYVCPSCGGEIFADGTTSATQCPYCGNPTIIEKQLTGIYKPDGIIPFKTTKTDAINTLEKFYNKYLVPKDFKAHNKIEKIQGVYVPFWLFDCSTYGSFTYNGIRTKSWRSGDYIYTKKDHYLVIRKGTVDFHKVPMDGSQKMDDTFMQSIEPFDYREINGFNDKYLSGYLADKYDVEAKDCLPTINSRVRNSVTSLFSSTISSYDHLTPRSTRIDIKEGKVNYVLMPVWILNTIWNGKKFTFMMNGQTSEVIGDLPSDIVKAILTWLLIVVACVAIAFIVTIVVKG